MLQSLAEPLCEGRRFTNGTRIAGTYENGTVHNVDNMGWRGTKDRDLLALADAHPFDVFITADKIYLTNKVLVLIN